MNNAKNTREIVLDTETTGLSCEQGDRIVEIGCVELINGVPTGEEYHVYVNPQRKMSDEAIRVCGITNEFLADKPLFQDVVDDFLNFVGDSRLVIHNAKFDIGFLNSELEKLGKPLFNLDNVVDTLAIARKKYPGSPASLDALCKRFEIDTSIRSKHGALIDCILLADVYVNLLGGRQGALGFETQSTSNAGIDVVQCTTRCKRIYRDFAPTPEELCAHEEFIKKLTSPIWLND